MDILVHGGVSVFGASVQASSVASEASTSQLTVLPIATRTPVN